MINLRNNYDTQINYEAKFNNAINQYKDLVNFKYIRAFADKCVSLHTMYGLDAISAQVYMDKVIELNETNRRELDMWASQYNIKG